MNNLDEDKIILVKIGGSVITDKSRPFKDNARVIDRIADEIHASRELLNAKLIIGHGGGSYPHPIANQFHVNDGIFKSDPRGVVLVQEAASFLNKLVIRSLINAGENAISIQPSASIISDTSGIIKWDLGVMKRMINLGFLPVIYGDVVMDLDQGYRIISTEQLFFYLSKHFPIQKIVIGTDVDGVLNYSSVDLKKYDYITPDIWQKISRSVEGSRNIDVTGGMKSKVEILIQMAKDGIISEIVNAYQPGILESSIKGNDHLGTVIRPND